jgi:hypothetical protein
MLVFILLFDASTRDIGQADIGKRFNAFDHRNRGRAKIGDH